MGQDTKDIPTNATTSSAGAAGANDAAAQVDNRADVDVGRAPARRDRSRNFKTARDFLLGELKPRCDEAGAKLRECLNGSICIYLRDKDEFYFMDCASQQLKIEEVSEGRGDCQIELNEVHFLKILSGELNPQIAMLSDKIKVKGRLGLAVYFFNLVAPQNH